MNALNSILSYIQRPKAIDTLESLGISMFADQAKTQFRNFQDIIADIAAKMPEHGATIRKAFVDAAGGIENMDEDLKAALGTEEDWTDVQQRDIAQSAAGVYRRNYFIALLERQYRIQAVLNSMIGAEGYSMQENSRYMSTLEAQTKTFTAELTRLATTIGEEGLMDFSKDLIYFGTEGVKSLDAIVEKVGSLPPALAAVMGTMVLFRRQMELFTVTPQATGGFFSKIGINEANGMVKALQNVNTVYREMMSPSYRGTMIDPTLWQKASTGVLAFGRALNVTGIAAKTLGIALNMAINVFAGLAIGLIVQKVYELVQAQEQAAEAAKTTAKEIAQQQQGIEDLQDQYVKVIRNGKDDADSKKELIRIERQLKEALGDSGKGIDLQNKSLEQNIKLTNEATKAKLNEYLNTQKLNYLAAKKILDNPAPLTVGLRQSTPGLAASDLPPDIPFSGKTLQEQYKQVSDALGKYNAILKDSNDTNKDAYYYVAMLTDAYNKLGTKIAQKGPIVDNYEKGLKKQIDDMKAQADATKNAALAQVQYGAYVAADNKNIVSLSKELDTLAGAYETLSSDQQLSGSAMLDMIKDHKEIAEYILKTNDLTLDSGKIVRQVFEIKKKALIAELQTLKTNTDAKIAEYQRERDQAIAAYYSMFSVRTGLFIVMANQMMGQYLQNPDVKAAMNEAESLAARIAAMGKVNIGSWSSGGSGKTKSDEDKYLEEQAALDEVNTLLARNASLREKAEGDEWITLSQKRLALYNDERKAINSLLEAKKKEMNATKTGTKEYYDLKNAINALYVDWLNAENDIADTQEEITKHYEDLMQERMDTAEKAKDKSIQNIQDEYDAYIKAENAKLDALDQKKEDTERNRALDDYEAKRKDLLDQRHYHEIRSGEEHRQAIIDIDKQLADLEEEQVRQQQDWQTEDEQQAIEDRIDQYETERDEKIKIISDTWDKVQEELSDANIKMLEKAGVFSTQLFSIYDQNFFQPMITAFASMGTGSPANVSVPSIDSVATATVGGTTPDGTSGGKTTVTNPTTGKTWYIHPEDAEKYKKEGYVVGTAPSAAAGGYTKVEGLYNLHPGELIINPELTKSLAAFLKPFSSGNVTTKTTDNSRSVMDSSRHVNVEKAVNIEKAYFADDVDAKILGRETARQILIIGKS